LSPLGRHQAQALAAYLEDAPLDTVLASPLQRARDTATPLAAAHGLRVETRDGLREMAFGDWEGLHWPAIQAADPGFAERWAGDPASIPCPAGESAGDFAVRVHEAFTGILGEFRGRTIAIAAHAGTNRALLSHALGRPYLEMFAFAQDYGCVNAGEWTDEHGQIAMVNFVPGPRSSQNGDGGRRLEERA